MTSIAKLSQLSILSLFFLVTLVAATNCNCGRDRGGDHGRDEQDRGGDHGRDSGDDHGRHHNRTLPSPTPAPATRTSIGAIVTSSLFSQLLDKNKLLGCDGGSFYTHNAFMAAAKAYPAFGCTGSEEQRKTEIAAFFAQTSAQTAGGGLLSTGYCLVESTDKNNYCQPSSTWSCAPGKSYHGRGALQLKWNYNYGPCGRALGFDGIANPDIVAKDPEMAFKTALWFWMTPQGNMPSCHDVILGVWKPSASDRAAGRVTASYGTVTNIINGHQECGKGSNARAKARVAFYERLGLLMGVTTGSNVDCYNQKPWATDN